MVAVMTFNGIDMSRFFKVTDIVRPIGNKRSVSTDDAPLLGVNIQQVRRGAKEHVVKFFMKTGTPEEMEALKHDLAGVLDVSEPVKIIYGDEPDKYYMGMPIDDVTPSNVTRWFQRSELTLLIPDGVAHSTSYRSFDSSSNATVASDRMTFALSNGGTVPAHPIITVKHNAENGYLGFVTAQNAFELGNREETDREVVRNSEVLLDFRDNSVLTGFTRATKNAGITNVTQRYNGTLNTISVWSRQHIQLINANQPSTDTWGSLTWAIPNDSSGGAGSLNDYIWWRQVFLLGTSNQYGTIKMTVSDEQGRFLYGVETIKRAQGLECEYNFFATDGKGGSNLLKRWTFTGIDTDEHNPFNRQRGAAEIKRVDDVVAVYWFGSTNLLTIPELKGKKSAKIHVSLGVPAGKPALNHMYLDGLFYRKDFVTSIRDVPNRFPSGSVVTINSEADTVHVDGIARISDVVDGSQWLAIPPGRSTLEIYFSSFVRTKPSVRIEFEERWL